MPAWLAPMLASTALSAGQGWMASRAAEQQEKRMKAQAAQDRLLQSFGAQAQPTPVRAQQPGVGQQMLADPLTQKLLAGLIGKGIGGLGTPPPVTPPPVTPRAYMPGVYP